MYKCTYVYVYTLQPSSDRFSLRNLVCFYAVNGRERREGYPKFNINSRHC